MTPFSDFWRGDGVFKAWRFKTFTFLIAIRKNWHWYFVKPPGKPGYKRLYLGPFEFELSPFGAR